MAMVHSAPGMAQNPASNGSSQGAQQQTAPQGSQAPQGRDSAPQGKQTPQARDRAPQGQQSQGQQPRGDGKNAVQSREQGQQGPQGQKPKGSASQRGNDDRTTGQGERGQSKGSQGQSNQQKPDSPRQGQTQQPPSQPDRGGIQGQTQSQPQAQPQAGPDGQRQGQPQQAGRDGSPVNLSAEQRTRIRTTVLAGNNVPRVNNVNFSIHVGTMVPRHVRVVEVPPVLIEIYPQWRGHRYFVVRDEIIIVDRDYRIVSVVPVGTGSGAQLDRRRGDTVVLTLSSEEIRQVQIMLKQKGFAIEVDGLMGPRTRQAIVAFQRQQGLQATGEIDRSTSVALGVSLGGPSPDQTTGQGSRQSPPAAQPPQNPAGDNSPGPADRMAPQGGSSTPPSDGIQNQPPAK
jgi:hypothetical protein